MDIIFCLDNVICGTDAQLNQVIDHYKSLELLVSFCARKDMLSLQCDAFRVLADLFKQSEI